MIVCQLDRLTRSVKDPCNLLELFEKRGVSVISVNEALDSGSAAGRLVITIMGAVSQWEREAIGERTREAMRHKKSNGERVAISHTANGSLITFRKQSSRFFVGEDRNFEVSRGRTFLLDWADLITRIPSNTCAR